MVHSHHQWQETNFWKHILEATHEDDAVRLTLQNCMKRVETVLESGGTSPPDFTLHDHHHAFRVAQRCVDLHAGELPSGLSSIECALLLLASYLHDIGMIPERGVGQRHYQFILTAEEGLLSPDEIEALQAWLDAERSGLELPIPKEQLTACGLAKADEICAYYCRHRHNDWSEEWIRNELSESSLIGVVEVKLFLSSRSLDRVVRGSLASLRGRRQAAA